MANKPKLTGQQIRQRVKLYKIALNHIKNIALQLGYTNPSIATSSAYLIITYNRIRHYVRIRAMTITITRHTYITTNEPDLPTRPTRIENPKCFDIVREILTEYTKPENQITQPYW